MEYPDLKIRFQNKILTLKFLGEFNAEKDKDGHPIILKGTGQTKENYLLSIITALTESGEVEMITIIPINLRARLNRRYYDTSRLKNIWRMPGVYAFVSIRNNQSIKDPRYKYVGRASNTIAKRLRGYLAPGSTQSTNEHVNRLIFASLKKGNRVLVYFFPEPDTEKELHRSLQPEWNQEVPQPVRK